jgi:hypothetical protein
MFDKLYDIVKQALDYNVCPNHHFAWETTNGLDFSFKCHKCALKIVITPDMMKHMDMMRGMIKERRARQTGS